MYQPLVSIIIPVYNGSNYMREAIDSALAQTYLNIEVIVVNDGSRDDGETERIAQSYGNKIRYIYKENGGVSTALNTGIRAMTGEYFSWLSHDDVYTVDKIEKSVNALSNLSDKKTVVACGSMHIDSKSSPIKGKNTTARAPIFLKWDDVLMKLQKEGSFNGCALLIHKDILFECGLFDETLRFNQDGFMWNKIFLHKYSLMQIPDVCVMNRVHAKQLTQTGQALFRSDCEKMSEYLIPELLKVSNAQRNVISEYIKYNAKYGNGTVVKRAMIEAKAKGLLKVNDLQVINILRGYGSIRPFIRKVYYAVVRKIKTT